MTADLPQWLALIAAVLAPWLAFAWGKERQRQRFRPNCKCDHADAESCRFNWLTSCPCECHGTLTPCVCREDGRE